MKTLNAVKDAELIARGSTADVYIWGDDILKLFFERSPWHANEVAASRLAHDAGLPVPEVIEGLIEVDDREGIIFERVDGPLLTELINNQPDQVETFARQAAELKAQIHSTEGADLPPLVDILTWSIQQLDHLGERCRKTLLDMIYGLPAEGVLCHNDFYPGNIIISAQGPVVIDWATGSCGSHLADLARSWLISMMSLAELKEKRVPEPQQLAGQRFWETYYRVYGELRPYSSRDLEPWRIVAAAASLVWGPAEIVNDLRISFIKSALCCAEHPWLN